MEISWSEIKRIVDERELSIQWVELGDNYVLRAIDGFFDLTCILSRDSALADTNDFETNYKDLGNQSPKSQVITQFEMRDKTLKLASGSGDVDTGTGVATILIKIPGTPGSGEGRWISEGVAFFSEPHIGDMITGLYFTDEDDILEMGAGTVVGSYTDDDAVEANRGWYVLPIRGFVEAEAIGGYGFAPAGFYIKIVGKKASGHYSGKMFINFTWGKVE